MRRRLSNRLTFDVCIGHSISSRKALFGVFSVCITFGNYTASSSVTR